MDDHRRAIPSIRGAPEAGSNTEIQHIRIVSARPIETSGYHNPGIIDGTDETITLFSLVINSHKIIVTYGKNL
jgi:hypothetical protein